MTGLFVTAGDWINVYEEQGSYFLAAVEQKVFQLNPHDEQHELRIALYLTERWREQARKGPLRRADFDAEPPGGERDLHR